MNKKVKNELLEKSMEKFKNQINEQIKDEISKVYNKLNKLDSSVQEYYIIHDDRFDTLKSRVELFTKDIKLQIDTIR